MEYEGKNIIMAQKLSKKENSKKGNKSFILNRTWQEPLIRAHFSQFWCAFVFLFCFFVLLLLVAN